MISAQYRALVIAACCVLLAMVTIQSGSSIAKQLFPQVGPEGTTALRLGFSALVLWLIFRPWRAMPGPTQWRNTIVYGLCLGGMNITFYYAIERIPIGIGVALEFTGPLAVALLSSKRKRDLIWVAFAAAGLLLLVPEIDAETGLDPIGVILALVAGGFWAGYILFGKRTSNQSSGGITVALGISVAALVLVPYGAISQGTALLDTNILIMGLFIGVLSSALPYTLEMIALRAMPAQGFSIMMSMEPAIAALAGFLILHEQLSLLQWLAIILVIIATLGSTLQGDDEANTEQE